MDNNIENEKIENNNDFLEVIKHPQIGTKQKKKTFINIFKGNIDEELLSFLLILIEKERILFLKEKGYNICIKPDSSILENEIRMCN